MLEEFPDSEESINHYLENMDNDLVMYATASRLFFTYRMVRHMIEHQGAHTFLDTLENSPRARLTIGLKNVKAEGAIRACFRSAGSLRLQCWSCILSAI